MKTEVKMQVKIKSFTIVAICSGANWVSFSVTEYSAGTNHIIVKDFLIRILDLAYLSVVLGMLANSDNSFTWKDEIKKLYEFLEEVDKEYQEIQGEQN